MKQLKTYMVVGGKEYNTIYQAYKAGYFVGDELVMQWRGGRGASVIYRNSKSLGINIFPRHMSNKEIDFFVKRGFAIKVHEYIRYSKYQRRKIIKNMISLFNNLNAEEQYEYIIRESKRDARCTFAGSNIDVYEYGSVLKWYSRRGAKIKFKKDL